MQQKSELPEGWTECQLEEIVIINYGKGLKKSDRTEGQFNVFGSNGVIGKHNQFLTNGPTIIIGRKGSIGEINISSKSCWPIDTTYYIDNFCEIDHIFLCYLLKTLNLANYDTSTAIPGINRNDIYSQIVHLPPLPEQHRIVSAIEALFARLDATNEKLDRVPEILKKFRESVLAVAFDGRLTEDWRKVNPEVESISSTISHMQSSETDVKGRANYKIKKIDESKLLNLPSKWEWHSIISVSNRVTVGHVGPMKDEYIEEGIPFLRSQNVRENRYDPSGLKYISHEFHSKIKKSALEPKDLVVVRSGNVGVSCVIPNFLKEANCSDLVVVKQPFGFISEYGSYYLNSIAKSTIELNKVGIALSHFNTQSVANLTIPLPPLPEQQEIVRRVDALFTFADSIESNVAAARDKTEKLRQSILAKAFSGQLVETEAEIAKREGKDYETAEVLLERIKTEKKISKKK